MLHSSLNPIKTVRGPNTCFYVFSVLAAGPGCGAACSEVKLRTQTHSTSTSRRPRMDQSHVHWTTVSGRPCPLCTSLTPSYSFFCIYSLSYFLPNERCLADLSFLPTPTSEIMAPRPQTSLQKIYIDPAAIFRLH